MGQVYIGPTLRSVLTVGKRHDNTQFTGEKKAAATSRINIKLTTGK
jgi:predicted RNA binding protein with dsRBD fold (UPF0201 family)